MLISLHWDGSNAHGLHATPICVGVGNTNSVSSSTQYCIGYMPVISDLGANFTSQGTELKHYIRNKCIGAILQVLETASRSGVRCRLPSATTRGDEDEMILMPRLFSMNLDQPEAQGYWVLRFTVSNVSLLICMHVSLCYYVCVLMLPRMCPYVNTHMSLCLYIYVSL